MILSYHPCYDADVNRLCAGRKPDDSDRSAIRAAHAVVLPQGCREDLYRMARENCAHVFPDYDVRFRFPGKTGQARFFQRMQVLHPRTWIFDDTDCFRRRGIPPEAAFPLVFKLDWGGEGEAVLLLRTPADLTRALARAEAHERSGPCGFILQRFVPGENRTLRVAVIGRRLEAYWRIQDNPRVFGTSVANGARIDATADPVLRRAGIAAVDRLSRRSGINLAGFDLMFGTGGERDPLFLEINYFFGRTGLGGSTTFYAMLQREIDRWLEHLDPPPAGHRAKRHPVER